MAAAATLSKQALLPPQGFPNYGPKAMAIFALWADRVRNVYARHGFTPLEVSSVMTADVLRYKGGIEKQIFGVTQMNAEVRDIKLGLKFDQTVPLAAYVASRVNEIHLPFKRSVVGEVYRGEHAQAGRFRGFMQADVDTLDRSLSPLADAECIATVSKAIESLEVGPFTIRMNHIAVPRFLIEEAGVPEEHREAVLRLVDKLDKREGAEIAAEICALSEGLEEAKIARLVEQMQFNGNIEEFAAAFADRSEATGNAVRHLQEVLASVEGLGADPSRIQLCPGMVRGLDYYTGTVFETFLEGGEKFGSIASGGRYSNLVGALNPRGKGIEGVGYSLGLTRLFDIMVRSGRIEEGGETISTHFVSYASPAELPRALEIARELRARGLNVEIYTGNPSKGLGAQLKVAQRKGLPNTVLVMADKIAIKNMISGEQRDFADLGSFIAGFDREAEVAPEPEGAAATEAEVAPEPEGAAAAAGAGEGSGE